MQNLEKFCTFFFRRVNSGKILTEFNMYYTVSKPGISSISRNILFLIKIKICRFFARKNFSINLIPQKFYANLKIKNAGFRHSMMLSNDHHLLTNSHSMDASGLEYVANVSLWETWNTFINQKLFVLALFAVDGFCFIRFAKSGTSTGCPKILGWRKRKISLGLSRWEIKHQGDQVHFLPSLMAFILRHPVFFENFLFVFWVLDLTDRTFQIS
jgi:hypothetical protein